AVEVAGKIEQENFEQHRALVEHRPPSEARHAVVAAPAHVRPHRVDAVTEAAAGIEPNIRGGIAEIASALVAVDDLGAYEPGIAEEGVCFRNPPGGKRRADRSGAYRPSRVLEARHDVHGKAEPCALRGEIFRRALAMEAETKIKAKGDAGDGEARDQNARDEVWRRQTRQRRVETQHDGAAKPRRGQKPQLGALVGEAEQRRVGTEKAAR